MGQGLFFQRLRTSGLLLALFALTFKALLPPGYMLTPEHDRVVVALCTVNGAVNVAMPLSGGAPDDHGSDHDERSAPPCVFATIGAIDVPAPAPALRAPVAVASTIEAPLPVARVSHDLAAPPPWSTGPPLSI